MNRLLLTLDDGTQVVVEDASGSGSRGLQPAGLGTAAGAATLSLERVVTQLQELVKSVGRRLVEAAEEAQPDEVKLELGLKLDAEAGLIITKTSAGAHVRLELSWKRR
jgi:hypothetical protein